MPDVWRNYVTAALLAFLAAHDPSVASSRTTVISSAIPHRRSPLQAYANPDTHHQPHAQHFSLLASAALIASSWATSILAPVPPPPLRVH
ncbi:hypothetical protein B0H14DRAFT_3453249 [Mycena olivaceomarginata]|nr:hypothetical protein B0H14DRAFT_3453249 [Mycena olivaceomarginata]